MTNEESRLIWNISPNISAVIEDGPDNYKLNVGTIIVFYNKDTTDNFTQVTTAASVHKEFTQQHRLDIKGDADWLYEPRGSGSTEGLGDIVNELVNTSSKM